MGTGYTRNDTTNNIADGNVINAADLDGEFDAIVTALGTGGHTHDGTAAEGGPVTVLGPAQDFVVSASIVSPKTDNTLDLGTSTLEFKDLYLDGTAHIDTLDVDENANIDGNLVVGGNLTVAGTTAFNGGTITLGDAAGDSVVFGADINSSIIPNTDSAFDLGSSTQEWRDLFLDGTAHIDTLDVDVNATVAGTLGVTGVLTTTATQVATGGITSGSNIVSDTDSTDDLGTTSVRWANLFVDGITATDQITATGFTGTLDGILGSGAAATASVTTLDTSGAVNLNLTTDSTSSTSGALIVDGGVGIAKKLFVGSTLGVTGVATVGGLTIGSAVITEAELEILDGANVTTAELNIIDGGTSATSTTVADADRVVLNDNGTMVQVAVTDLAAYFDDEITEMPNLITTAATTVGALNSGSITSGFGTIDTGSSTITTTGLISGGSLDIDNVLINGTTIGHTDDTDLITLADGIVTVAGEVSLTTLDIGGTNVTSTAAELNIVDGGTSATSTTVVDADRVVMNDNGTMVQVAVTDLAAYFDDEITAMPNLVTTAATTVGALDSGSITSNFGTINTGASAVTTTGLITGGSLTVDEMTLDVDTLTATDDFILDVEGDIEINANGGTITFKDNGATLGTVTSAGFSGTSAGIAVSDSNANTNFPVVFHDESNALLDDTGALRYNPSTGQLLVPNLTVAGTTTTVDTVTMEAANAIIFEGATADAHETTLTIVDPTADRTVNIPNQSGTIPLLAAASNTAITSTPEELNLLDTASANSVVNSKAVIYGSSGELAGVLSTAGQTNVTSLGTLTALTVDDVAINGKAMTMTGSSSDTAVFTVGTNGTLSIITTDDAAAAANIQITADGTAELAGTTVTLDSAGDIELAATDDINVPSGVGMTFGNDGEKIEGDGTDLAINSSGDLNVTATTVDINATTVEISGATTQTGISTSAATDIFNAGLSVKNGSTSGGFVQFFESGGTSNLKVIAPALAADATLTLPAVAGTIATIANAIDEATALAIALG